MSVVGSPRGRSGGRRARTSRSRRAGGGRGRRAARAAGGCRRARANRGGASASVTRISISARAGRSPGRACARTSSARSVATWSLRERAVWSLPPGGPISSVRRRSIAMWMSSSSSRNSKRPPIELAADLVEALGDLRELVLVEHPEPPSARAWALDCSRSNGASRQSKEIEELIRLEERVLFFAEAGHAVKRATAQPRPSPPRAQGFAERRADPIDLLIGHRGEERQGERALGDPLGDRELAALEAEPLAVGRQQVDAGQVGLRRDPLLRERRDHRVAIGAHRELDHEDEPAAPLVAAVLAGQDEVVGLALARRPRPERRALAVEVATLSRASSSSSSRSTWAIPIAACKSVSR